MDHKGAWRFCYSPILVLLCTTSLHMMSLSVDALIIENCLVSTYVEVDLSEVELFLPSPVQCTGLGLYFAYESVCLCVCNHFSPHPLHLEL